MPIFNAIPHPSPQSAGSRHPGTGVYCYVALAGCLIYAIIVLTHANYRPAEITRSTPPPVAVTIPLLAPTTDSCIRVTDTGWLACDAESAMRTNREHLKRRYAHNLHLASIGAANLLWAPPGAVLVVPDSDWQVPKPVNPRLIEAAVSQPPESDAGAPSPRTLVTLR